MDFRDFLELWLSVGAIQGIVLFGLDEEHRAEIVTLIILVVCGPVFFPAVIGISLLQWIRSGKLVSRLNGYFMSRSLKNKYPHLTSRERADLQAVIATDIDQRVDEIVMWRNRA